MGNDAYNEWKKGAFDKSIKKKEQRFSSHAYKGNLFGRCIGTIERKSDIAVLALKAVKSEDENGRFIDPSRNTGAFVRLMAQETDCNAIFVQKTIERKNRDKSIEQLRTALKNVKCLISIESRSDIESTVEVSVFDNTDNRQFIQQYIQYVFEYTFQDYYNCVRISDSIVDQFLHDTNVIENKTIVQVVFNSKEFDLKAEDYFLSIKRIVLSLVNMDWEAEKKYAYRLWQSDEQIPQDKMEYDPATLGGESLQKNSLVHVRSFHDVHETVRIHQSPDTTMEKLQNHVSDNKLSMEKSQFVMLTNRMIENLFGREWLEEGEDAPGLFAAPLIVYENRKEQYSLGIPKADQIDEVSLSSKLYHEKLPYSDKYDYIVYNRYSDSRLVLDFEKADYKDNGRVDKNRVMLPRYYRLMMGYYELPLKSIRAEEYYRLTESLLDMQENDEDITHEDRNTEEASVQKDLDDSKTIEKATKQDFELLYKKMGKQAYYSLKDFGNVESREEQAKIDAAKRRVINHLKNEHVYDKVSLIRIPKTKVKRDNPIRNLLNRIKLKILKITIGKAEYNLKCVWANDPDDKNDVARINENMMNLIGVSENDKIMIRFGNRSVTLRVLADGSLEDYEIRIPAPGRRRLGMSNMYDVVKVHRDMEHTFKRHSQEQTIAILGTVLAVAQVLTAFPFFTDSWYGIIIGILVCFLAIVLILYFALSEERVKVK